VASGVNQLLSRPVLQPTLGFCGVVLEANDNEEESKQMKLDIDPFVGGAALRVLAAVGRNLNYSNNSNNTDHLQILHGFSNALHKFADSFSSLVEADRLAFVQASSFFASSSSEALVLVLQDATTRAAWLDVSQLSKSKLKAAILLSVARVLDPTMTTLETNTAGATAAIPPLPHYPLDSSAAMPLYLQLGIENNTTNSTTSEWLRP
jgi:hypothetical protein